MTTSSAGPGLPHTSRRIAVTGGSGFVGGHLARRLASAGHEVVVVARGVDQRPWARRVNDTPGIEIARGTIADVDDLARAFTGCDAVAHCAGINRELGAQTYDAVHVRGTENVVRAAEVAGVKRLASVSFLRARPGCGSGYHESKWAAEEIVRSSRLEWTVVKPGMMFGPGDHMLDHLSKALFTVPVFIGVGDRRVRPLAVEDAVRVLAAALVDGALLRQTVGLVGPTEMSFDDAARLVAVAIGRRRLFVPAPLVFHRLLAWLAERAMIVPLVSTAQVRILEEGVTQPVLAPDHITDPALLPSTPFDLASIRAGLPEPGPFSWRDLRLPRRHDRAGARWSRAAARHRS